MKGCLFIGELPGCLLGTELDNKLATQRWMQKLFLNHGFRVSVVNYDEVARNVLGGPEEKPFNVLFVARQLRLSDAQVHCVSSQYHKGVYSISQHAHVEAWRSHVERIDEEGDEEGFEEL